MDSSCLRHGRASTGRKNSELLGHGSFSTLVFPSLVGNNELRLKARHYDGFCAHEIRICVLLKQLAVDGSRGVAMRSRRFRKRDIEAHCF